MILQALLLQAAAPTLGALPPPLHVSPIPFKRARRYEGIWIDRFEGQAFVARARLVRDGDFRRELPWLEIDRTKVLRDWIDRTHPGTRLPDLYDMRAYRVRFVGREARDMDCRKTDRSLSACYGHMGTARGLIVVDKMLSIEPVAIPISSGNRR